MNPFDQWWMGQYLTDSIRPICERAFLAGAASVAPVEEPSGKNDHASILAACRAALIRRYSLSLAELCEEVDRAGITLFTSNKEMLLNTLLYRKGESVGIIKNPRPIGGFTLKEET